MPSSCGERHRRPVHHARREVVAQHQRGRGGHDRITVVLTISTSRIVVGSGIGAVVACLVVAGLLFSISPLLAVVVLLGAPVVAIMVGPVLGRLGSVAAEYRVKQGRLTADLVDVVEGLRLLNGIGGREHFRAVANLSAGVRPAHLAALLFSSRERGLLTDEELLRLTGIAHDAGRGPDINESDLADGWCGLVRAGHPPFSS